MSAPDRAPDQSRDDGPSRDRDHEADLPRRTPWLYRGFLRYARRYAGRHFHGIRVLHPPRLDQLRRRPTIVYLNHPAWWDPILASVACERWFRERRNFAVIESIMLQRYRIFERIGFFAVEPNSVRGGLQLLRTGGALLASPEAVLWITAQGHFTDARVRPVELAPGISHLARRAEGVVLLPMALEYPFWTERFPEALMSFGEPIEADAPPDREALHAQLERSLERAMDELAAAAMARDPSAFTTLVGGRAGAGGVYGLWERMRAWVKGERYRPEHMPEPEQEAAS